MKPDTYLLHHLLTQSAARFPNKEAVRYDGQALTYAELDDLSNRLAYTLQEAGVRRGHRVGIYLHKSPASVISIFAILKAGGVYVPLDPNAPAARLAYIIDNCDINVMITAPDKRDAVAAILQEGARLQTIILAEPSKEDAPFPDAAVSARHIPWDAVNAAPGDAVDNSGAIETDLAYLLYTSGSTGQPKGVMIAHRTIFTFINWCLHRFNIDENDRVTSHAPIHFDLSTFDIFVTIAAGGTVVLVPEKLSIFPIQLVRLLQEERITATYMVPSVLSMMVNYGKLDAHDLSALRLILFAGEVFPIKYLRQLIRKVPHADYYNLYGPTETNVCTYYHVQPADLAPERTQPVPIGVACENMEVFAVGSDGSLVETPGAEGELWVRGSCVAQGYWNDPEKTAQRFVPNPYQPHYLETAYRTGDIVVLDEDGDNWRFIGRRDHMIKSRGYRIELGEIESALYACNGVKEAAAVAIPDDLVGNRIKAFIVIANSNNITVQDLEAHCRNHLPGYMVPETFHFLDALPKTSTGKIDRVELTKLD